MTLREKLTATDKDLSNLIESLEKLHNEVYDRAPNTLSFICGAAHGLSSLLENMRANVRSRGRGEEEFYG